MDSTSSLDLTGHHLFSTPEDVRPFLMNILRGGCIDYFDREYRAEIAGIAKNDRFCGQSVLYRLDHDLAEKEFCDGERLRLVNEVRARVSAILLEHGVNKVALLQQDVPACTYRQQRLPDGSYTEKVKGWGVVTENPDLVVKVSIFIPPTQRVARSWTFNHPDIAQERSFQLADYQGWATVAPRQNHMQTLEDILECLSVYERLQKVLRAMRANFFMHKEDFVHGDVKPGNIDAFGKLFDLEDALPHGHTEFGLFTPLYSEAVYYHYLMGSYRLPKCTYKKDVFSWGITLLQVLLGITSENMAALLQKNIPGHKDKEKALHASIARALKHKKKLAGFIPLLQAMVRRLPSKRPTLERVMAAIEKLMAQAYPTSNR